MELTFVVQSLLPPKPGEPDPWPLVVKRITEGTPEPYDFVLLNECKGWAENEDLIKRAQDDLGLEALRPGRSRSGLATLIMYRQQTVGFPQPLGQGRIGVLHEDTTDRSYHGWSIGAWDVGLPLPLAVGSYKLTPYSADAARIEAQYVATHPYRWGAYGVLGGDTNFSPANPHNPPPNWATQLPYNLGSRALPGTARTWSPVADRSVAQAFVDNGWCDVAWEYANARKDHSVLTHTSEFDRIDGGWVTVPLRSAVTGYWTLDAPMGASDHAGVAWRLDTALIEPGGLFEWR